ncbi:hypothetical protein DY000_02055008 [Brassica cretica]|uniref:C2 NT-type domain-containing protein n=1 Tax=Brassica cretica TaxID=69181 RepID=A0ABQ7AK80_BRACR|nr:hypothetical protein DY000_02055008 [Brassica cretica]
MRTVFSAKVVAMGMEGKKGSERQTNTKEVRKGNCLWNHKIWLLKVTQQKKKKKMIKARLFAADTRRTAVLRFKYVCHEKSLTLVTMELAELVMGRKDHKAKCNMRCSSVNSIKKKSLTSGKRVKFRKKLICDDLCLVERLSPSRMAGKKASSKSLCGFVFLLHILENQIVESASLPSDVEHNGPEEVHGKGNQKSSWHIWCMLLQQGQHKFLLSGKRVKRRREQRKE